MLPIGCPVIDKCIEQNKFCSCKKCNVKYRYNLSFSIDYNGHLVKKPTILTLCASDCKFTGTAIARKTNGKSVVYERVQAFEVLIKELKGVEAIKYGFKQALSFYLDDNPGKLEYIFPGVKNAQQYCDKLNEIIDYSEKMARNETEFRESNLQYYNWEIEQELEIEEKRARQQRKLERRLENLKKQKYEYFETETKKYFIGSSFPRYAFYEENLCSFTMFLDGKNDLHFMLINGNSFETIHGVIPYDNIRFFGKGEQTRREGNSSYGGSLIADNFPLKHAIMGGMLFYAKGDRYWQSTYNPDTLKYFMDNRIIGNARTVLSFYSPELKRNIDIEFPSDIYDFFTSFIPDKKYEIAIEELRELEANGSFAARAKRMPYVDEIDFRDAETIEMLKNEAGLNIGEEDEILNQIVMKSSRLDEELAASEKEVLADIESRYQEMENQEIQYSSYDEVQEVQYEPYGESQAVELEPYGEAQEIQYEPYGESRAVEFEPYGESQEIQYEPYGESAAADYEDYPTTEDEGYQSYAQSTQIEYEAYPTAESEVPVNNMQNQPYFENHYAQQAVMLAQPVVHARPEPVVEARPEPVVEARPEPVVEARPEPVAEARPEPVAEVRPEPVAEVRPEPVAEARPESVGSVEDFTALVQKLLISKELGLLNDEEFAEEKRKIIERHLKG